MLTAQCLLVFTHQRILLYAYKFIDEIGNDIWYLIKRCVFKINILARISVCTYRRRGYNTVISSMCQRQRDCLFGDFSQLSSLVHCTIALTELFLQYDSLAHLLPTRIANCSIHFYSISFILYIISSILFTLCSFASTCYPYRLPYIPRP